MSLLEQMSWVDRLVRRPDELDRARSLPGDDGAVLSTVDAARLAAVHHTFAALVAGRWWVPRFPATLEALAAPGDPGEVERRLIREDAFEAAVGEDETGAAFVNGVLDALEGGRLTAAPWGRDLLAYEYLLAVSLPRRACGEAVDAALEARLLPAEAAWVSGDALRVPVLVCPFQWSVAELAESLAESLADAVPDPEPDPHDRLLFAVDGEVIDAAPPPEAGDALQLLAAGAPEQAVVDALGEVGAEALAWLREAGAI